MIKYQRKLTMKKEGQKKRVIKEEYSIKKIKKIIKII